MPDAAAAQVPTRIAPPPLGWNAAKTNGGADADKKAIQSLVFGIVSFVFDPLLLPTIIAIVYGAKSLRAGTANRSHAIAGLTLGIAGAVIAIVTAAIAIPLFLALQHSATSESLESRITEGMAKQGIVLTDVTCPTAGSTAQGATLTCTGQQPGQGAVRLDVVFTDSVGSYRVRATRAA